MEKKTLSSLIEGKIFQIPDYQRGYSWDEKQWKDFAQDIDALIDDKIVNHYTGTIVIYQPPDKPTENYGTKKLEVVDVVDGQQRLTTCSLYLSIILKKLIAEGEKDFEQDIPLYLRNGSICKLRLNNDTADFFLDLISSGLPQIKPSTIHQKRLLDGYDFLRIYLDAQINQRKEEKIEYLKNLYDAIIRKLNFSFYPIDVESEIGMTFELMNSRGKELSPLELLKNYLMYWTYRNSETENEKEELTKIINKSWKDVYINIANCNGKEDQCLRIAWTLMCTHTPKYWAGYEGFKENHVIPLRDFSKKSKKLTKSFICDFANSLSAISNHYSEILNPSESSNTKEEISWLTKIKNAGNIASFLPLMVASRLVYKTDKIEHAVFIDLLKALEMYSFRVFLWEARRSNAGLSSLYKWGNEIFLNAQPMESVIKWIYGLIINYSSEDLFRESVSTIGNWYNHRRLLKYTLFEYELQLLKEEGKNASPHLKWEDLLDSTIEHIFPQTPDKNSLWLKKWNREDIEKYTHDISNLVLTRDNSNYRNFEFDRKKGKVGSGYCYANSDIREERKIAEFTDWTVESCISRRKTLNTWIFERWGINIVVKVPQNIEEDDDTDTIIE